MMTRVPTLPSSGLQYMRQEIPCFHPTPISMIRIYTAAASVHIYAYAMQQNVNKTHALSLLYSRIFLLENVQNYVGGMPGGPDRKSINTASIL